MFFAESGSTCTLRNMIFFFKPYRLLLISLFTLLVLSACSKKNKPSADNPEDESSATGEKYGGGKESFDLAEFKNQPICPGLVYIEGGKTTLGVLQEDFLFENDQIERTVTVKSFYMDETEVANVHWKEYMFYLKRDSSEEIYNAAVPDTSCWSRALSFNDAYVDHYFSYPGFRFYPVVGVSWKQVIGFCAWRTEMVKMKLSGKSPAASGPKDSWRKQNFYQNTDAVKPKEEEKVEKPKNNQEQNSNEIPGYRLPTEDEWEYAAMAVIDVWAKDENSQKRIYPWDGTNIRNPHNKKRGIFLANFKRGRGDYAGIAGQMNDGAMITDYIYAYPPNDFGLYNMSGNVNEWVYDKYKPKLLDKDPSIDPNAPAEENPENEEEKDDEYYTLLGSDVRVYKGGSWKDVAFWLTPGSRRFLEEDSSTATIGFRCAMDKLGGKGK